MELPSTFHDTSPPAPPLRSASNHPPSREELAEASRQFEAVLLKQFVEEALKPILHEGPGANMAGGEVYRHYIAEAIADNLSQSHSFGFSSLLQTQLAGEVTDRGSETKTRKEI